jgi:hypothetical protein
MRNKHFPSRVYSFLFQSWARVLIGLRAPGRNPPALPLSRSFVNFICATVFALARSRAFFGGRAVAIPVSFRAHRYIYLSSFPLFLYISVSSCLYRRELNLAVSSSPVTKTMYIFNKVYCYFMKLEKISSSAPG